MLHALRTRIAIYALCRRAKRLAQSRGVRAKISWLGAYYIHPSHLAVAVRVRTDGDRAALNSDLSFIPALRTELAAVNYPAAGREGVKFDIESQETVDRDFNGSWYYRFK